MMKRFFRLTALLLALCMPLGLIVHGEAQSEVRLVGLNIGKADCLLLLWQDRAYLIDTGYAQTYPALETALSQYGVSHLNGVFLTHCHKDHQGGLMPLAQSRIAVDAWYASPIYYDIDKEGHPAVLAAAVRNEAVTWLSAGGVIDCGGGASFTVLGPLTVNEENENNNSLVMRFSSTAGSILLTGDMKEEEEAALLASNLLAECDVLKVGHHGDNKATSAEMLKAVKPQIALILTSTQEEPDTPAASTVKRLQDIGCAVHVSQQYSDAMLLTLQNGTAAVTDVKWSDIPERIRGVALSIDLNDDTVTLKNTSDAAVTLSGCSLFSTKGDETLSLPDITLAAGQTYIIGTKSTQGSMDCQWDDKKVWNKNKRDMAILYDAWGRALARTDNGLSE